MVFMVFSLEVLSDTLIASTPFKHRLIYRRYHQALNHLHNPPRYDLPDIEQTRQSTYVCFPATTVPAPLDAPSTNAAESRQSATHPIFAVAGSWGGTTAIGE